MEMTITANEATEMIVIKIAKKMKAPERNDFFTTPGRPEIIAFTLPL